MNREDFYKIEIGNECDNCGLNCGIILPIFIWKKLKLLCYWCWMKEMKLVKENEK